MKGKSLNSLKENVKKYLINNNLRPSDIKESIPVFEDGHFFLKVTFKNGDFHRFRFFPYEINKLGYGAIGTTAIVLTAAGVIGSYGNYKFKENNEKIILNKIDESEIVMTNDTLEELSPEIDNMGVVFEYVDSNNLDPYNLIYESNIYDLNDDANKRKIDVIGSGFPNITSYNYVMNNYYDQIDKYGSRYGVDPAIIASIIMVECGGEKYDRESQEKTSALGLGQVNCKLFENQEFNVYNCDTGSFEKYKFETSKLMNNHDEQIKFIAILMQYYSNRFSGNLNAMTVSYNQGMGTVNNILNKIVSDTDYKDKDSVLNASDGALISKYNTYTYGDPEYFNKVMTYLNYLTSQRAFGSDVAKVVCNGDVELTYKVETEYKIAGYNNYESVGQIR